MNDLYYSKFIKVRTLPRFIFSVCVCVYGRSSGHSLFRREKLAAYAGVGVNWVGKAQAVEFFAEIDR